MVFPELVILVLLDPDSITSAHASGAAILLLLLAIALDERGLHVFQVSKEKRERKGDNSIC